MPAAMPRAAVTPSPQAAGDNPAISATPLASGNENDFLLLPPLVARSLPPGAGAPFLTARQGGPAPNLADLCFAECSAPAEEKVVTEDVFWRGRLLLETNVGAYFSQRGLGPKTPTFDFLPINVRLGAVLHDPCFPGCIRGSYEALVEFSTAPVFSGFGHIVVGPTAILRYNFAQPDCRLVPYLQGGAGFAYTDGFEDRQQHAIGQWFEFTLKAAAGLHYFVNRNLAVDVEGGYTHISNADIASRNLGINAVGGSIGVTFSLPCGRR
jgi:hypothetical protein